ncbi:hypothetical protein DL768_008977 [Monosporascus sp. mg162]|nr:hypothetical protein DL768_008977 [Monosporascus sp. mg162]
MHLPAVVLIALAGQTLAAPPVGAGLAIRMVPDEECAPLCDDCPAEDPACRDACFADCRAAAQQGEVITAEGLAKRTLPLRFCNRHCERLCNSPLFSQALLNFIEPCCSTNCNNVCRTAAVGGGPVGDA